MLPRLSWSRLCAFGATCALVVSIAPFGAFASPYTVRKVAELAADKPAAPAEAGGGAQAAMEVTQKGREFMPAAVTIRVHRRITIHNDDDVVHHAFCQAPDFKYNSGPQQPGTTHSLMFRTPGVYEIRCAVHPSMLLTVTVTE